MSSNVERAREAAAVAKSDQLDTWAAYAGAMFRLGLSLGRGDLAAMTYREAFDLAHDTGLGARQDYREIVRGIIDGYSAGCRARHQLVAELLGKEPPCVKDEDTRPRPGPSSATPAAATTPATSARPSSAPTPTG